MVEFEPGNHSIEERACSRKSCTKVIIVEHGGQKSGSMPVIYVDKPGNQAQGFCSQGCLSLFLGYEADRETLEKKTWNKLGIKGDDDFYTDPFYVTTRRLAGKDNINIQRGGDEND